MSKKTLLLCLCIVATLVVGLGSTLAYLTDVDTKVNTFTVGNVDITVDEEFVQDSPLTPGVEVNKDARLTNDGATPAWVWMTVSVPADVDEYLTLNWADGITPESELMTGTDGNEYMVYTVLVEEQLAAGESTDWLLDSVTLSESVDYQNGEYVAVVDGVVTPIGADLSELDVIVSGYAVQVDGFDDVEAAYDAYHDQWNDTQIPTDVVTEPDVVASTSEQLAEAIANLSEEDNTVVIALKDGRYETNLEIPGGAGVTIVGEGEDTVLYGQIASTTSDAGTLTLKNLTYEVSDEIEDSTGISQTGSSAIALWGNQTVICEDVTFEMTKNDATAITAWWDTHEGTTIDLRNCTFNCNGQRPVRATGNVSVRNCTFNDPYRYAVQLTAKASTATELDNAVVDFYDNTIIDGPNGKNFVYGIQLEGSDYGCNNLIINGDGNTIVDGGVGSTMYYCECGKVVHETVVCNTESALVHKN